MIQQQRPCRGAELGHNFASDPPSSAVLGSETIATKNNCAIRRCQIPTTSCGTTIATQQPISIDQIAVTQFMRETDKLRHVPQLDESSFLVDQGSSGASSDNVRRHSKN